MTDIAFGTKQDMHVSLADVIDVIEVYPPVQAASPQSSNNLSDSTPQNHHHSPQQKHTEKVRYRWVAGHISISPNQPAVLDHHPTQGQDDPHTTVRILLL
jgi:hypothetical protein